MSILSPRAAMLAVLRLGDNYALGIIEYLNNATGGQARLHEGTIYADLRELEKEGLMTSWEQPTPDEASRAARGGRPRRYYRLTHAGLAEAEQIRQAMLNLYRISVTHGMVD